MRATLAAIAVVLVVAGLAQAAGEPVSFGTAFLGTLSVTSGIVVSPTSVDMRGVWQDRKLPCSAERRLTVKAQVYYTPFTGKPSRIAFSRIFRDSNCAEGGPNVGFSLTAKMLGLACRNGRWKPARYSFVTTTTERARKLRSTVSLDWEKRARC